MSIDAMIVRRTGNSGSYKGCMVIGGLDLSDSAIGSDSDANFPNNVIVKAVSSAETGLFDIQVPKLNYGLYSVMIRIKVNNKNSTGKLIQLSSYTSAGADEEDVLLDKASIEAEHFTDDGQYKTFGFITDYKGSDVDNTKLRIVATLVANSTSGITTTVTIDNLAINPTFTAITALEPDSN